MKQLIFAILILSLISCGGSDMPVTPSPKPIDTLQPPHDTTVVPVDTASVYVPLTTEPKYLAMGTVNSYSSAESALAQINSGRPYYFTIPFPALHERLYNTPNQSDIYVGSGNWIAITFNHGTTWKAILVDNKGVIQQIK